MNLTFVPTATLVALHRDLRARRGVVDLEVTTVPLTEIERSHLLPLGGLPVGIGVELLEAVLLERRERERLEPELVWSGPEATVGFSRPTSDVVRDLFQSASRSVLLAGYSFDHADEIFRPLHSRMKEHGVRASWFVHLDPPAQLADPAEIAVAVAARFLEHHWPFGDPEPELFVDLRTLDRAARSSLHAKCIVVDERRVLVGSANFTDRGQTRNIELGLLVDSAGLGTNVVRQFFAGVSDGVFVRVRSS